MAEQDARPLTDEERAELEALRAEKARRERAELEALRAEEAAAVPPAPAPAPQPASAARQAPAAAAPAPRAAAPDKPVVAEDPAERTFGQRMVLSDTEDEDGLPSMPPAQKIVIGVCLVLAVVVIIYVTMTNNGMIG
ncbi:hypothetical protein [Collinsella intestinalis]|uniref:hypothetical protein n=1 Tax=Collinsella intestinalis TaxID=147207 RepID=UPI00195D42AB|nr:hypothetical protein [Collinsella intestinalis]MBM6907878.1 hypothetical protein [Collinsella intestinalis]MBM6943398.1 hypothetical protein [Collinsella intestinalis]